MMEIELIPKDKSTYPSSGLIVLTYLIYGLHLFSAVTGLLTPAFVLIAFLTGWPSIIAVLLNYLQVNDVKGTYLESHFRWQIRTFWFALFWLVVSAILAITVIGLPAAILIAWVTGLWVLYRILRGVFRLMNNQAMPMS